MSSTIPTGPPTIGDPCLPVHGDDGVPPVVRLGRPAPDDPATWADTLGHRETHPRISLVVTNVPDYGQIRLMIKLVRRWSELPLRPAQFALFFLSGLVPRDPRRWVLGTWGGMRFADNSAEVFRYLNDDARNSVRSAWITRRREIRDDLRTQGMNSHLAWSPRGVWWALRSGVYLYDSTPRDINYWTSRRARLVLLQHGTGMKKIERAIDAESHRLFKLFHGLPYEKLMWRIALPWHTAVPDLVAACSPDHARQAVSFFGVEMDHVRVTGLPRHDRLAAVKQGLRSDIPTVGPTIPDDRPVFLYLPTFREGVGRQSFDWATLQRAASAADVTVAVKLHVVDAERGVRGLSEVSDSSHLRIVDATIDPVDVYPLADGLITDYSSVAYDLLLMGRPVIHYVPDLHDFVAHRPLIAPFDELAVGPICLDGDDLAEALIASADPSNEEMIERRRTVRQRCFTYPPGGASERVVEAIETMVR